MNLTFSPIYHNTDNKDREFKVGKFRELNLYAVEISDITGTISEENAVLGGKDILLMGLTEKEFMLKETDKSALHTLVNSLADNIPKDRLISYRQINYKGEIVEDKNITPKSDTIDDGEYVKYTQSMAIYIPDDISVAINSDYYLAANYYLRATSIVEDKKTDEIREKIKQLKKIVLKKLKALNELYYVYNKSIGERFPTIGPNGAIWLFTLENLVQDIITKNKEVDFAYKKITQKDFEVILNHMYRFGMTDIIFNPGFDFAFAIKRDEYMPIIGYEDRKITNSELHYNTIRFLQNKAIKLDNCQKAASSLWGMINQNLTQTVFLTPMMFEDEVAKDIKISDNKVYFTQNACEIAKNINLNFFNMGKFDTAPQCPDKEMTYITLKSKDVNDCEKSWFPVFTDIFELRSILGDNLRICAISFNEIIAHTKDKMDGICLNPYGVNLRLEINNENKTSQDAQTDTQDNPKKKSIIKKIFNK